MNRAEQIIADELGDWNLIEADRITEVADDIARRLRGAGIDLDHTYEQPRDALGWLWWRDEDGVFIADPPDPELKPCEPLYVRRPLERVSAEPTPADGAGSHGTEDGEG